jgi:AAA+ superfamily predicted ATPase
MSPEIIAKNAKDIQQEIAWFKQVLVTRSKLNTKEEKQYKDVYEIQPPQLNGSNSHYHQFIKKHDLGFDERFTLMMALAPHLNPKSLDMFLPPNGTPSKITSGFGGIRGKNHHGFLPTGETVSFVLAGSEMQRKFSIYQLFDEEHAFNKHKILWLEDSEKGEPFLSGALSISKETIDLITRGELRRPKFSSEFPAKLVSTEMEWSDLVLAQKTKFQFVEIDAWLKHNDNLMEKWGMAKKLKKGYRSLFYGPPGTGKTLTAALLGKKANRDVFRVDLSKVVSKYIGETEKNLAKLFDQAENKEWILFFDEADAIFGKRTNVSDAHDRYANQEVSYLLQRIEDYNGLVILASNLKNNLDDAFIRRFQSIIHFPMPKADDRFNLWKKGFPEMCKFDAKVDLKQISKDYEIAGGSIINIVQYSLLMAIARNDNTIQKKDIMDGIRKEYAKTGRTI